MDWVPIILAAAIALVVVGGLATRIFTTKVDKETKALTRGLGIGWQFIRFMVIGTGVPVIGLLAWKGAIGGDVAASLLAAAMGYAFGKAGKEE